MSAMILVYFRLSSYTPSAPKSAGGDTNPRRMASDLVCISNGRQASAQHNRSDGIILQFSDQGATQGCSFSTTLLFFFNSSAQDISWLPNGHTLVHDMWPNNVSHLPTDTKERPLRPSDIVPSDFYALVEWATFKAAPIAGIRTRRYQLVQSDDNARSFIRGFCVEGFLKKHNIHPTGNWKETEEHAPAAKQYALDNVLRLAANATQGAAKSNDCKDGKIFLQNPIFSKVLDTTDAPVSVLSDEDDPTGAARNLDSTWRCLNKVHFACRITSSHTTVCQPVVFEDGDFISVHVTVGVVEHRRKKGGGFQIIPCLNFDEVIQLCPASLVATVMDVDNRVD
ncbi:hypothetical protein OF83DRAFT_1179786 [Amylostereum chailletii]|nr:hypothetical protein OF83DRAFT_1179786 [Amylostereum chailletii]